MKSNYRLIICAYAALCFGGTAAAQSASHNLRTCLSGQYPSLCDMSRLTERQRDEAKIAERRANLATCLSGRYPSLCKHEMLSLTEGRMVREAERQANLTICRSGQYPSLCKHELLSAAEAPQVDGAERAANLRTCMSGQYPSLCRHELLSTADARRVSAAETAAVKTRPTPSAPVRNSGGGGGDCESDHWISSVSSGGEIIKLEDGSIWEVDSVDTVDSSLWLPMESIVACSAKLINTDNGEKVDARKLR